MSVRRARFGVLGGIALCAVASAGWLGLSPQQLWPDAQAWEQLLRFASAALSPAWRSQSDLALPLLPQVLEAAWQTVAFAVAATSLSLLAGGVLGVMASQRWWRLLGLPRSVAGPVYVGTRACLGFMRSIHEILWALALLAAFGLHPAAAVLAIAIPYSGTLAKVFSEMLDEAPRGSADALEEAGAGAVVIFVFGLVPRALPDLSGYAFYRFECALRSAAVLGFFGFPTLGKRIHEATGQLYFHEAWTYLYALIVLVALAELWSAGLRQRFVVA